MAMNKWVKVLIAVIAVTAISTYAFGYAWTWVTFAFSAAIIAALGYFNFFGLGSGFKRQNLMYAAIGLFVVSFAFGGLNIAGFTFEGLAAGGISGLPAGIEAAPESVSTACVVSQELYGKSATLTLNGYDQESNTPFSSTVSTTAYVYQDGKMVNQTTTNTQAISNRLSVGDTVSVYGGNQGGSPVAVSKYYLDPVVGLCIDKENYNLDLDAHQWASAGAMLITGYDDTGGTALSGGTNSSQEDYDITLGANQEDTFYLKFKNNGANQAFNLYGIAITTQNDVDRCGPVDGQGLTETVVRDWLDKPIISDDGIGTTMNWTSGWERVWVLSEPDMLSEWESVKWQFTIESDADTAANEDPSASDVCAVLFIDANYERGGDGLMYLDYYVHDSDEGRAGISENSTQPLGKDTGVIIEGI